MPWDDYGTFDLGPENSDGCYDEVSHISFSGHFHLREILQGHFRTLIDLLIDFLRVIMGYLLILMRQLVSTIDSL